MKDVMRNVPDLQNIKKKTLRGQLTPKKKLDLSPLKIMYTLTPQAQGKEEFDIMQNLRSPPVTQNLHFSRYSGYHSYIQ